MLTKRTTIIAGAIGLAVGLALGGGAALYAAKSGLAAPADDGHGESRHDEHGHEGHAEGVVEFPEEKWATAGLEIAPARMGDLAIVRTATGKVTANEDRLAHVYSLAEGIVHEVNVRYGDRVEAGEPLAVIDSREVGQAKLALVQARKDVRIAEVEAEWARTIADERPGPDRRPGGRAADPARSSTASRAGRWATTASSSSRPTPSSSRPGPRRTATAS